MTKNKEFKTGNLVENDYFSLEFTPDEAYFPIKVVGDDEIGKISVYKGILFVEGEEQYYEYELSDNAFYSYVLNNPAFDCFNIPENHFIPASFVVYLGIETSDVSLVGLDTVDASIRNLTSVSDDYFFGIRRGIENIYNLTTTSIDFLGQIRDLLATDSARQSNIYDMLDSSNQKLQYLIADNEVIKAKLTDIELNTNP